MVPETELRNTPKKARADHLLHGLKGRAVRGHHREHEKRHHDEAAADAQKRPHKPHADTDAEKFCKGKKFSHDSNHPENRARPQF